MLSTSIPPESVYPNTLAVGEAGIACEEGVNTFTTLVEGDGLTEYTGRGRGVNKIVRKTVEVIPE